MIKEICSNVQQLTVRHDCDIQGALFSLYEYDVHIKYDM
jgi:hypothetical protein